MHPTVLSWMRERKLIPDSIAPKLDDLFAFGCGVTVIDDDPVDDSKE